MDSMGRYLRAAMTDASKLDDIEGEKGNLLELTDNILFVWGRYDEAYNNYQDLLQYYSINKDLRKLSAVQNGIGNIHSRRRDDVEALDNYEKSLAIRRELKIKYDIAITLLELGLLYIDQFKYDQALPQIIEAYLLLRYLKNSLERRALKKLSLILESIGKTEYDIQYKGL